MPAVHIIISGKVQGVFFRDTARKTAKQLGITGWVKNTDDDKVEAVASGTQEQLDKFIEWCHKGSEKAVVTNVSVSEAKDEKFKEFKVIRE